jgi:hypothetical protein
MYLAAAEFARLFVLGRHAVLVGKPFQLCTVENGELSPVGIIPRVRA